VALTMRRKLAGRRSSAQFWGANVHVHTLLLCIGAVGTN
jgi:hypothetical protein